MSPLWNLREAESRRIVTTDWEGRKGGRGREFVSGYKGAPEKEKWLLDFCSSIG